jgi:hypothetical protein
VREKRDERRVEHRLDEDDHADEQEQAAHLADASFTSCGESFPQAA